MARLGRRFFDGPAARGDVLKLVIHASDIGTAAITWQARFTMPFVRLPESSPGWRSTSLSYSRTTLH